MAENGPDGVYGRIKARLLAQPPVPGQLLQIGAIADELGVSGTPVREALTRLAAERLIVCTPRRGFFVKTPAEDEMRGLCVVNRSLLTAAIESWTEAPIQRLVEKSSVSTRVGSAGVVGATSAVQQTEQLFLAIATHSRIGELIDIVRNVNDRLRHWRLVEFEIVPGSHSALSDMCRLYEAGKREELRGLLGRYHDERLRLSSIICKELLFRSFPSGLKSR